MKKETPENEAKGSLRDVSISTKSSIEVCNFIRKKKLQKAKNMLQKVIDMRAAVPMKRFNKDAGHKKKIGPGKYPIKVCKEILRLLDQVEANAQFKGLSTSDLVISHIKADKAATPWHYGRKRRRKMKRTHVEIMVTEKIDKKKEQTEKVEKEEYKKEIVKTEDKKEPIKEEVKVKKEKTETKKEIKKERKDDKQSEKSEEKKK